MIDQEKIHNQCLSEDPEERIKALEQLRNNFSSIQDKQQAWDDIIKMATAKEWEVKYSATDVLSYASSHVPNKQQVWSDLIKLTNDEDHYTRYIVAKNLDYVFSKLPDKQQAWKDLHKMITHSDSSVRYGAVSTLGSAYSFLPDKQQALRDLIKLTSDKDNEVRSRAAYALCINYFILPEKQQAFKNLIKLTNDESKSIRAYAYYTLGKVSIFNASHAEKEEDYKEELEKAITFFEAAAVESNHARFNPAQFCLPFYRSFYSIVFKKHSSEKKIDKYLAEAYSAINGSESKELLLEIIKNLANALKDVNNLKNLNLDAKIDELNSYRIYCDRAVELIIDAEEAAPYATAAMRKGLPFLDKNLKVLIKEIREKAKNACHESIGTPTQEIACTVNKEIQEREISDELELKQFLEDMAYSLKRKIIDISEDDYLLNKIESMKNEKSTGRKLRTLSFVIENLPTIRVVPEQALDSKFQKFDLVCSEIVNIKDKLSCISFNVSKIKLNSANVIPDLKTMKQELEKLNKIQGLNTLSIEALNSTQADKLEDLSNDIMQRLDEIRILIDDFPKNNETQEFYNKLSELKQSKSDMLLQKSSAIISLISFAMQIIQCRAI